MIGLPSWVGTLEAAADWGTAPWEITGDDDRLVWYIRWLEYRSAQGRANRDKRKHKAK